MEYDPVDGEATIVGDMWRGNTENGPFETYYDTGQLKRRSTRKDTFDVGPVEVWHKNGQKSAEFTNNELGNTEGEFKTWYPNGQLHTTGTTVNGRLVGVHETYFDNGQLEMRTVYPDTWKGNEHPIEPRERFYPNGQIRSIEPYDENGIKNGTETEWFEDGQKEYEVEYVNNEPVRSTHWFQNGDLESKKQWDEDGHKTGVWEKYRWDWDKKKSVPQERTTYRNGAKNGIYEEYYPNGQMKMQTNFKDSTAEGLTETWNEDGKPFLRFVRKDRKEIGHEYYNYDNNEVVQMYTMRNGTGEPHNYVRRLPMEGYTPLTEEELSTYPGWAREEILADPTMFRVVKDKKELDKLNNDPKGYIDAYASMAKIDGKYYPPMAAQIKDEAGKTVKAEPMEIGDWTEAEERTKDDPNIRVGEDGKWEYHLIKPDGKDLWVAYNPYAHSTLSPLNDQFTAAHARPELVMVKVRIPKSDLDGYQAEGAKDAVGETPWHSGPVSAKLKGTEDERKVILSRYRQLVEEVPVEEEAKAIADVLSRHDNIAMPINVVRPQLREALRELGVKFGPIKGSVSKEDRKELNKILSDIRFRENKNAQDELKGVDIYSDEFKSWFGDWQNDPEHSSKVVDENGKPLVVYHGTDLNQTNQGESFYVFYGDSHFGTWEQARDRVFSPYNKEAKYKIYNVYLNIRNPKRVQDMPGDWKETSSEYWEPIIKKAKEEGYDGIVYENLWEGSETADSYIAFEPNQIKLAEPLSFDSEGKLIPASRRYRKYNDDIRFREGENTLFSQEEMQGNVNSSRNNGIFASNTQNNERRESDIWREGNRDRTEDTGRRTDAVSAAQPEEIVKPLRKLEEGETCHVERKLTKTGDFNFVGKDRIESLDDVAYIFRQLENKSVENTFMVFVKDGKATVLHVGIGLVSSSPADMSGLTVMMRNIKPDKVYMVHNHPSGQLISSNNDRALWAGLRKILGDKLEPGIIINTTSGKYGVYEGDAISSEKRDFKDIKGDIRIPVYRFDENVFSKDYDPSGTPLRTSRDVAEFVSSHRLGERDKLSVLCLDHSQKVRGNFFLPYTGFRRAEEIDKIAADCAYYTAMSGADAVVIYGNGAVPGIGTLDALAVRKIKEFLYINNMSLVEIVGDYRDDTGDYYSWFDHGKMTEPDAYYGKRQELKQAEADTDTNPTEGQKEAGNYRKGHIRLFGMELSIENPQGSERSGVDQDGNEWSQKMNNTYGYIRGTAGRDKDHIDFFLGPDLMSDKVFVVDQRNVKTGVFDEHKVMLGFDDIDQARAAYNSNYEEGWLGLGAITESDMDDFKEWAFREGRRVKPFSETNGDGAVLFRTREPQEYQRIETSLGVAAARYEKAMDQMGVRLNEVMQDSMRSVRELQDAISQADGKPIHDFENAYWAAIQYSSRNKAMQEAYHKLFYRPLMKEVARLTSGVRDKEAAMDELNAYLMAKHGLERNEVFARRDAKRQYEEHMSKHPNSNMTEDDFYNRCRRKDYSGLTALTMEDHVADAEQKARIIVDNYESNHDVKELWRRINAATKETLRTSLQGGLLSQEKYAELATMFENYVPLRGFDETTSDDIYGYYGTVNSPYNTAIKKAYGRRSLADSPLATIGNIADSEIMRANRNRIYLAALSLAENHHNGLLSVSEVMFMRNPQTGQWEIALPPLDVNDTPEEVAQKMSAFRNWFAQQLMTDPMNYRTSSEMANVPYKVISKNALSEHQIMATRGGKQYIITVNGNPRAAQALAGKTNPDSSPALQWLAPFNRFLAQVFTQYNPSFVLANLTRDGIYTNAMVWAKESPAYARKYNANWTKSLASMGPLLVKYKKGTLDDNVPIERYFKEFIDNGGETGYTQLRSVKDYKKLMQKELKDVTSLSPAAAGRKVMGAIGDAVENMNRWAEGVSRFAAYMTSREQGRSVVRSVEDAKEISVNFNKKGSGVAAMTDKDREERMLMNVARASQLGRELFVFFNAGVQGMANAGGVVKNNPGKATALMAGLFLAGAALAMMNGGDGDDEKEYYNLPEYIRRSNICLKAGKHWITIPLPIELRALYGLGELAYSVMSGNEYYEPEELSYEVASQLSQILPIDFLEGNQGTMAFMPSGIKPLAENRLNQDWTGAPIYNKTPYNEDDPAWRKAFSSTNPTLVTMSRKLSEATGGNVGKRGWIDVNPAKVEHLFEGYLGGVGTTLNQAYKTARALTGDTDMREIRNVPVVSRFVRDADDRAAVRAENSRYYKVKKYVDEVMNEDRRLRQVIAEKTITGYDYDDDAIKDAERRHRELQDSDEWRFVQQWRNLDKGRTNAREGHDEDEFNALTKKMNDLYKDFRKRQRDE